MDILAQKKENGETVLSHVSGLGLKNQTSGNLYLLNHTNEANLTVFIVSQRLNYSCACSVISVDYFSVADVDGGVVEVGRTVVCKYNNVANVRVGYSGT